MEKIKRKILITGGTSGIGFAVAERSLEEGLFPIMTYLNDDFNTEKAQERLEQKGFINERDFKILYFDVSSIESINKAMSIFSADDLNDVYYLVNSAAILKRGSILTLSAEDWGVTLNTNVLGIVNMSKYFYENCLNASAIINIGSIRGEPAVARSENAAYSISKSTIPTLTALLAKTFQKKIRVNAVSPGTTDTKQRAGISETENKKSGYENTILERIGKPEEIADMVLFLLSDKALYITGSNFIVDGGYSVNYIK